MHKLLVTLFTFASILTFEAWEWTVDGNNEPTTHLTHVALKKAAPLDKIYVNHSMRVNSSYFWYVVQMKLPEATEWNTVTQVKNVPYSFSEWVHCNEVVLLDHTDWVWQLRIKGWDNEFPTTYYYLEWETTLQCQE